MTDTAADLTGLAEARARAEAAELSAMLAFHDAEYDAAGEYENHHTREAARAVIALEIGQAVGLSENQVQNRLYAARRVRNQTPAVWWGFLEGRIDSIRMQMISGAVEKLERPESVKRLETRVVTYAETHTTTELKRWLRDFVNRVEADLAVARAEDARKERYVSIEHGDDAMGTLYAYLPSHMLAAIATRLRKAGATPVETTGDEEPDTRTRAQREADLLASWATTSDATDPAIGGDIAVTIDADVLAGATDGFATSADGSWAAPAAWITELAENGDAFWHRILVDPVTDDVLSHEYLGRFAPKLLRKALAFRDGACQTDGCLKPADQCEIDHIEPWPDGRTIGSNLEPKCKRHHNAKGHGLLVKGRPLGRYRPVFAFDLAA